MKKSEEKILDLWLQGKTLAEIALETGKTIFQIASVIEKLSAIVKQQKNEYSLDKEASLKQTNPPQYDEQRVEQILESSDPLSTEEIEQLHKAIDYWEYINEIADEKWDADVLENITKELMRISRRLSMGARPVENSQKNDKVLLKIRQAQVAIKQLQQPEDQLTKTQPPPSVDGEVLDLLQTALTAEFQQWDLYYAYKSQLRGMARDPVSDHFGDHAEEEASHIEILQRYIVGYGEQPTTTRELIPSLGANPTMEEIVKLQLHFEQKAVETYKQLLTLLEETDPLKIEVENILTQEQEHVHDLQLLLV